jgi:hypothetical protein
LQVHGYHLMREHERVLTDADIFLLLHERRREDFPSCGCPPLAETAENVATKRPRR